MPVGVPKLPLLVPGDEDASWVDVYNRLYRQRLLFLCDEIDTELTNTIVSLFVYLNIEDETKNFYLFINSPGGWVTCGLAIYDTMQSVKGEVNTVAMGIAASMASVILLGGTESRRTAFPHARIMIHQPAGAFFSDRINNADLDGLEVSEMRDILTSIYVNRTGNPYEVVANDLEVDSFMSASEAKAYGIIDSVGFDIFEQIRGEKEKEREKEREKTKTKAKAKVEAKVEDEASGPIPNPTQNTTLEDRDGNSI
uniref:ATP-dependent Clp protease proteolytic subunit n=1 Tax=Schwalbea americana TaxID=86091 RepID=V6BQK5_9LAMI|nr:proteolytic subunit of the ATP-dependent Clp protease [Schwalbea americana]CDJ38649.1 proteolytic subunit of the ATP-dependent Clp protease [Schwalbea americana]